MENASVIIIDFREERRRGLKDWLGKGYPNHTILDYGREPKEGIDGDLVIIHAADEQVGNWSKFFEMFKRSLILGFVGGCPSSGFEKAKKEKHESVALWPFRVDCNSFDKDFVRIVSRVIDLLPERGRLAANWFVSIVEGFDAALEAKLDILCALIKGANVSEEPSNLLREVPRYRGPLTNSCLEGAKHDVIKLARLRAELFDEKAWMVARDAC
jgi:hypothetical protein